MKLSNCGDSLCKGSLGFHRGQYSPPYDLYARKLLVRGLDWRMKLARMDMQLFTRLYRCGNVPESRYIQGRDVGMLGYAHGERRLRI